MTKKKCPCGKGEMNLTTREKKTCCNGVDVHVTSGAYVCPCCGIEVGTVVQASEAQKTIADEYRKKTGLLTGDDIKKFRSAKGLSQKQLADLMDVCETSVQKWESGLVQDFTIDKRLRKILI
jgi:putative zinc finger/helix-turn-helix YgiT family protein